MSLRDTPTNTPTPGFPRVSGDEPVPVVTWGAWDAFSPRERG